MNYRQNSCIVRASKQFNVICNEHNLDPYAVGAAAAKGFSCRFTI